MLLHLSQHLESTESEGGLGPEPSTISLFLVVQPIIMDLFQSAYPEPSKGVDTSFNPAWLEGC